MQEPKWPNHLPKRDGSRATLKKTWDYAISKKADVMCVTKSYSSRSACALLSIDMKVWELDPHDAADIHKFLEKGELPERRELKQPYLFHYDSKTRRSYPKVGSCFLCLTREQGLGVLKVTSIGLTQSSNDPFSGTTPSGSASYEYTRIAR